MEHHYIIHIKEENLEYFIFKATYAHEAIRKNQGRYKIKFNIVPLEQWGYWRHSFSHKQNEKKTLESHVKIEEKITMLLETYSETKALKVAFQQSALKLEALFFHFSNIWKFQLKCCWGWGWILFMLWQMLKQLKYLSAPLLLKVCEKLGFLQVSQAKWQNNNYVSNSE